MTPAIDSGSQETKNTLFTVLSNHRRRYVLYACDRADDDPTLSDVAEQVAAWEYNKPVTKLTAAERKRVYSSIQQHHLPKLEEAGLIDVDNDQLCLTEDAENLDLYLEIVSERNIPWSVYYIGLAGIGGFLLGLAYLGWLPGPVSPLAVSGLVVVLFMLSAIAHFVQSQRIKIGNADLPPEIDE